MNFVSINTSFGRGCPFICGFWFGQYTNLWSQKKLLVVILEKAKTWDQKKMKPACFIALLLCLGLHFIIGSKGNDVKFNVRINERGTRFSEKIKINEKENTVRFTVPKHNDVDQSEVLHDFNLNLTITRLSEKGVCYIQPLVKHLSSPRDMKSDMRYVRRVQTRISKPGTLVSSTEWTLDRKVQTKDLQPSVAKFCAGLPVYRLKEITKDNWEIEEKERSSNETAGRSKRRYFFSLCPNQRNARLPCSPNSWTLHCKFVSRTCVYWAKCRVPGPLFSQSTSSMCRFVHDRSDMRCCEFRCWWQKW